ncbi:MAG: amino acid permease [Phycisphaerales bacterium]|nr:amino acid permease [Phycisphaerales bacterium]
MSQNKVGLKRVLSQGDLIFFGIAAIVGAGSFSSIGVACYQGGLGVVFLFLFCAVASILSALCYATFAARYPVSGSAYTYAYASMGKTMGWIVGWLLILEYSLANVYVTFAWSDYLTTSLHTIGIHIPLYLSTSYWDGYDAFVNNNVTTEDYRAWLVAPHVWHFKLLVDLPAIFINILVSCMAYIGIYTSKRINNGMVLIKLFILFLVVVVGVTLVKAKNLFTWLPNGFSGIMGSVSAVFFTYIGFDAISTLAEDAKNPKRDVPRSMIWSLVISTAIYIIVAMVLIGIVGYRQLDVADPLTFVFIPQGFTFFIVLIGITALIAMTSALLAFQISQPRVWFSMGRDGLLPDKFATIHPRYQTPSFATWITFVLISIFIICTGKQLMLDFTSLGTIVVFIIICLGVLIMDHKKMLPKQANTFTIPHIHGKWMIPLFLAIVICIQYANPLYFKELLYLDNNVPGHQSDILFHSVTNKITTLIFWIIFVVTVLVGTITNQSLIPLLGIITSLYLLTGMELRNWLLFLSWILIGLIFYYYYGYRKKTIVQQQA